METVASFVNILLKIYVRKLIFQDNGKLEGSGRTSRNAIDSSSKQNRKEREREEFWMKQLRTVNPYGLNKDFGDSNIKDNDSMVDRNFPFLHKSSSSKIRGMKHTSINKVSH